MRTRSMEGVHTMCVLCVRTGRGVRIRSGRLNPMGNRCVDGCGGDCEEQESIALVNLLSGELERIFDDTTELARVILEHVHLGVVVVY